MKIGILADLHIGAGRNWMNDIQSGEPFYLKRHRDCFKEIFEVLKKQKVEYVILAGDLLHHARPLPLESELLGWFLHDLSDLVEVHIISGNHENLWAGMTALHAVQAYTKANTNIHWHLEPECTFELYGKVLWASNFHTSKISDLIKQFQPDYVVAHYPAKGCVYESGMTAPKGYVFDYHVGQIKRWFLGDIHLRQNVAANASYVGSPLQIDFGESGAKGFDIFDTETGKLKQISLIKTIPLLTEVIKDSMPEFNSNALYRVLVSKEFLNHTYSANVVSVKPISKKTEEDVQHHKVIADEIDFGDPLAGLEDTLKRTKLSEGLFLEARQVAISL